MTFWMKHLTQTATVWERSGHALAAPRPLRCRWWPVEGVAHSESDRAGSAGPSVHLAEAVTPGGIIAPGEHSVSAPGWDLADLAEVVSVQRTSTLRGDPLFAATLRPIRLMLPETVQVFGMDQTVTTRSYELTRGQSLYSGPAAVLNRGEAGDGSFAGQAVQEWPVLVTVPASAGLRAAASVEIDWTGLHGTVTLEGRGGAHDSSWSPFWAAFACKLRRAE